MFGDCHMHMVLDGVYYKDAIAAHRGHVRDDLIRQRLSAYAVAGISYLRDGGDAFGAALRARELAPEYGIEYRAPVYPMCLKGRYGAFIGRAFETLDDYRAMVAEARRAGADFIKVMISGLVDFDRFGVITSEPLTANQIRELIAIAHGEGFSVMAHANGAQTVMAAIEAGVDSVEHGAYLDREAVEALASSGAVWVPTLVTIGNLIGCGRYPDDVLTRILDMQLKNVALCAEHGGSIALGSDNGAYQVPHVKGTLDEYALLKRALGPKTDDVLRAGESAIRERFVWDGRRP
ncbi:MAG: amidohydrolase family protein [Clostridia bacterium]|nr:amidohydrolase family protein [Clostridia bacterium]